jgi:hypothetical protein
VSCSTSFPAVCTSFRSLELSLQIGDWVGLSWYLSQFSVALAHDGRGEEAGRLWGAVEAAAAFVPGGPWPRDIDALREELSSRADAAFEHGRDEGHGVTLEAAADSVLRE